MMNPISITSDNLASTNARNQFDRGVYRQNQKRSTKSNDIEKNTHDNHHKYADSWWFELLMELVVEWNWRQERVSHYARSEPLRRFRQPSVVSWSNWNQTCGHVQSGRRGVDPVPHRFPNSSGAIDHAREIPRRSSSKTKNVVIYHDLAVHFSPRQTSFFLRARLIQTPSNI